MKIRYYTPAGKEAYASAGQTIPAGSYRVGPDGTPTRLIEPAVAVVREDNGNPYDQAARTERWLELETASDRQAAAEKIAAEEAARVERIAAESVREERQKAALVAAGFGPELASGEITTATLPCYAIQHIARLDGHYVLTTRTMRHQDARSDYTYQSEPYLAWAEWVEKIPVLPVPPGWRERLAAAKASYIARLDDGRHKANMATIRQYWREYGHDQAAYVWRHLREPARAILVRIAAAQEIAAAKRTARELIAAGVRREEAESAACDESAAQRLRDIAYVRRKFRALDTQSFRNRASGLRSLHPDAQALYQRAVEAQRRAASLRTARESRERAADEHNRTAAEQAARAAESNAMFGLGNAFAGLKF